MKKILFLISIILFNACGNKSDIPKPDKLIEKEVMENILYDLALLQAIKNYQPDKLKKHSIDHKTYIYQKYKIDSLQFAQNNKFYAADMDEYRLMFQNVSDKLKKEKDLNDTLLNRENKVKSKKIKDSLIKKEKQKAKSFKKNFKTIKKEKLLPN
jgi:Domain of unknown function (DUF4296)